MRRAAASTPSPPSPPRPGAPHALPPERQPRRVVIEVGSAAGWVRDLGQALALPIRIAYPNHEGRPRRSVKRNTDKDNAPKLARLSAMNLLPMATLPEAKGPQRRSLIAS